MARHLPPLSALRPFEAAARLESFSRAAEELHLTHGAVVPGQGLEATGRRSSRATASVALCLRPGVAPSGCARRSRRSPRRPTWRARAGVASRACCRVRLALAHAAPHPLRRRRIEVNVIARPRSPISRASSSTSPCSSAKGLAAVRLGRSSNVFRLRPEAETMPGSRNPAHAHHRTRTGAAGSSGSPLRASARTPLEGPYLAIPPTPAGGRAKAWPARAARSSAKTSSAGRSSASSGSRCLHASATGSSARRRSRMRPA